MEESQNKDINEIEEAWKTLEDSDFSIPKANRYQEMHKSIEGAKRISWANGGYTVGSKRPVIGPVIGFSKRALIKTLRPGLREIWSRQNAFNEYISDAVFELLRQLDKEALRLSTEAVQRSIEPDTSELIKDLADQIGEIISDYQILYVPYCGNGWILSVFSGVGIKCIGIESDNSFLSECDAKGLKYISKDPIDFLSDDFQNELNIEKGSLLLVFPGEREEPVQFLYELNVLSKSLSRGTAVICLNRNPYNQSMRETQDMYCLRFMNPETIKRLFGDRGFALDCAYSVGDSGSNQIESFSHDVEGALNLQIFKMT